MALLDNTLEAVANSSDWQTQSPGIFKRRGANGMEYTDGLGSLRSPTMGKGTSTPASMVPLTSNYPSATPSPLAGLDPSALTARMKAITAETDPNKRIEGLISFKGETEAALATLTGQIQSTADVQAGIPMLDRMVKESEALDKAHPMYSKFLSDSAQTAQARQQLDMARVRAGNMAARMLKENPTVASAVAQVDSFIKIQNALLQKDLSRADAKEQRVTDIMESISPETKADVWTVRPDLKGNDSATAQFLVQELKINKKDWEPIISGVIKPEELILQGVTGNRVAASLAVKKQVAATGMPEDSIVKQAKILNDFVNNPDAAAKIMKDFGLFPGSKEFKAYEMLGLKGNKQGVEEQTKVRLGMVEGLASKLMVNSINNNIDSWPVAPGSSGLMNLPEAGAIFEQFQRSAERKPTIQEFHNAYVNAEGIAPEERVRRSTLVQNSYKETLKKASSGIYGKDIDVVGLTNRLAITGVLKSMPNINSWR